MALFVGPVLVLISFFVGPTPLALVFNGFELAGLFLAVIITSHVTGQGESTWFEGLMLLALYIILAAASSSPSDAGWICSRVESACSPPRSSAA